MNHYLKKLKSFDIVIVLYCIITGIYMLFGYYQLHNILHHIFLRILFVAIIFFLIKAEESENKILLFVRNFYPLIFLGFFYSETDYYNNLIFENFDPGLIHLEELFFNTHLSLDFSKYIYFQWFSELMHFGYFSYYILTISIPLIFYIKSYDQFERVMFIIFLSFCFYYLIFILFPSVGPQFYFHVEQRSVPNGYLFHEIMKFIISIGETETGAFPSSHVGMATIYLLLMYKNFKKIFTLILPIVIILVFSTVYIKAHYVIDIIGGLITGILFYYFSNKIYSKYFLGITKPNIT